MNFDYADMYASTVQTIEIKCCYVAIDITKWRQQ